MTVVTGVSGSGKSTLVHDVLYRAWSASCPAARPSAKRHLGETVGAFDRLTGVGLLREVVLVDQSPIGRTPRSNPVTYIKAYDEVRRIFAVAAGQQAAGVRAGALLVQRGGRALRGVQGRGAGAGGDGVHGRRLRPLRDVRRRALPAGGAAGAATAASSIRDVLEMTVDESIRFFLHEDRLGEMLWHLQQVGLGYLRLGQPAPTLSRRRGAAHQGGARAGDGRAARRKEAVHPGRADHRPAHGRHPASCCACWATWRTRGTRWC